MSEAKSQEGTGPEQSQSQSQARAKVRERTVETEARADTRPPRSVKRWQSQRAFRSCPPEVGAATSTTTSTNFPFAPIPPIAPRSHYKFVPHSQKKGVVLFSRKTPGTFVRWLSGIFEPAKLGLEPRG